MPRDSVAARSLLCRLFEELVEAFRGLCPEDVAEAFEDSFELIGLVAKGSP